MGCFYLNERLSKQETWPHQSSFQAMRLFSNFCQVLEWDGSVESVDMEN